jgi:hypothetical protein
MMMRILKWCGSLTLCLLLGVAGCQQTNQLALYQLGQAELNQQLHAQAMRLNQRTKLAGLPVALQVTKLDAEIGPQGRSLIQLNVQATAEVRLALIDIPTQFQLRLAAEPYFDQQRQGVYLRQFELLDAKVAAGRWQGQLKPLSAELAAFLQQRLATVPVYQLDPNKLSHQALLNIPLQLKIKPGQLVLSPAY